MFSKITKFCILSLISLCTFTLGYSSWLLSGESLNTNVNVNTGKVYEMSDFLSFSNNNSFQQSTTFYNFCQDGFLNGNQITNLGTLSTSLTINLINIRESNMFSEFNLNKTLTLNASLQEIGTINFFQEPLMTSSSIQITCTDESNNILSITQNSNALSNKTFTSDFSIINISDSSENLTISISYTVDISSRLNGNAYYFRENIYPYMSASGYIMNASLKLLWNEN